ncbi:MAG: cytochrome d ubiquinol oxidase subunit II [Rhodothermales bacterium]|nr:cytochrome d ubiquinol oxidase subunit II [Rhodothermales bacterium]
MYETILALVMLAALVLYALFAGADYGGGMWDLLAFGPNRRQQRDAIADAIGPVWEANHVWLILVIVLLFSAFPPAFGMIMTALFMPMILILIGIVLRGTTFVFRKYDLQRDAVHRRWSAIFGIASFLTPFFLGLSLGALATGDIRVEEGVIISGFYAGWTTAFAVGCGLFAQGLFAYLAAVYMTVETEDNPAVQRDFQIRSLISAVTLAPAALLVYLLAGDGAPYLFDGLSQWWSPPIGAAVSLLGIGAVVALWVRRFAWARVAAVLQVTLILVGWGLAQFPYVIVPDVTFADAATAPATLRLLTLILGAGTVLLLPAFAYLFYIFKRRRLPADSR